LFDGLSSEEVAVAERVDVRESTNDEGNETPERNETNPVGVLTT